MSINLPPLVVRTLVFIYQEQFAWVKWGRVQFQQVQDPEWNKTWVLSPCFFFAIHIDDLIEELRNGCHIGDIFMGAAGFADDIILISPSRSSMQQMLSVCENLARKNNLTFSTDEIPDKSKTKCLYMCVGDGVQYPAPLKLNNVDLPWVVKGPHLGHELHQSCTMDFDAKFKRAAFIESITDN